MAKKDKIEELAFCDRCGGSIPKGTKPFQVEMPDGTTQSLCQECTWAARSEEEQPALALDDDIEVDATALRSIHRPEEETQEAIVEEDEEEQQDILDGPVPGGLTFRHCKSFVSQTTPQALDFLDEHINDFIKRHKVHVKSATAFYGMAGIGTQGTRTDAVFVTIWW